MFNFKLLKKSYWFIRFRIDRLIRMWIFSRAKGHLGPKIRLPFRLAYVYRDNSFDLHSREMGIHLLKNYEPVEVISFGAGERARGKASLTTRRFLNSVNRFNPDVLFTFDKFLTPEEMNILKKEGMKICGTCDGFASFDSDVLPQKKAVELLRKFDCYFVAHAPHVERLLREGIRAEEFPLWADTELFSPIEVAKDIEVLFIGTNSGHSRPYRQPILEKISAVAQLTVAGPFDQFRELPLARCLGPVKSKNEINRLFNRAKIVLGFDRLINEVTASNSKLGQVFFYDDVGFQIKDRTTCVLSSGACYFVEDHSENRRLFQHEKDLVLWSDPDDLVKKVRYYLEHPEERKRIGESARARVVKEYSVSVRAKQMIEKMRVLSAGD